MNESIFKHKTDDSSGFNLPPAPSLSGLDPDRKGTHRVRRSAWFASGNWSVGAVAIASLVLLLSGGHPDIVLGSAWSNPDEVEDQGTSAEIRDEAEQATNPRTDQNREEDQKPSSSSPAPPGEQGQNPFRRALPVISRVWLVSKYDLADTEGERSARIILDRATEIEQINDYTDESRRGLLAREIIRQALLIAAREGLGLPTRDATLGDSLLSDSRDSRLRMMASIAERRSAEITIHQSGREGQQPDLTEEIALPEDELLDLPALVTGAEALSRGPFLEILKTAGFEGTPGTDRPEAEISEEVSEALDRLNFFDQYDAIRRLHAAIRADGRSPARLGALARGYAQLGVLTESHWSPAHKVFKARALLYAQRLVASDPKSPWGLWHRAFAEALVGLHAVALADLKDAEELEQADGDQPAPDLHRPDWVDIIASFCRQKTNDLMVPDDHPCAQLALLLRFFTVEHSRSTPLIIEVARDVLRNNPECYRVCDAMCEYGGVNVQHKATLYGPKVMTTLLPAHLTEMPGLPEEVKDRLEAGEEPAALTALIEAGGPTRDSGEPSWAVLGQLVREDRFIQAMRRLWFMRIVWGVPTTQTLTELWPSVVDHPYRSYLLIFLVDPDRQKELSARVLQGLHPQDPEITEYPLLITLTQAGNPNGPIGLKLARGHLDQVSPDLEIGAIASVFGDPVEFARRLLRVSPDSPVARATLLRNVKGDTELPIAAWEADAADHPEIFHALAAYQLRQHHPLEAERYLERYVEKAPDRQGIEDLAEFKKNRGDLEGWRQTLEQALDLPDYGLDHMVIRVKIADQLMSKQQWEEALPYAEAAAETWAAAGMMCASQCNQGLERWERSELWIRRLSERYPESGAKEWMFWCQRTGHGDLKAAQEFAAEHQRDSQ